MDDVVIRMRRIWCTKGAEFTRRELQAGWEEIERLRTRVAELEEVRGPVRWFALQMEEKLRRHDDRGGWSGEPSAWLLERLREEVEELQGALYGPRQDVIEEAADVANFAMMIATNAAALGEEG